MVILGGDTQVAYELAEMMAGRRGGPDCRAPSASIAHARPSAPVAIPAPPAKSVAAPRAPPAPVGGWLKEIARHAAREAEREIIYRTLQQTRWNRREAADLLGVSYKALLYKIKEADLDRAS